LKKIAYLLVAGVSCAIMAFAQDAVGSLEGVVKDKTGGSIPGGVVTATNLETGLTKTQAVLNDGFYRFTLLPIGSYSLAIAAPHFAHFLQNRLPLR
jgi:hypothetical protein